MSETREGVWCPKCAALVTAFRFNGGQWRCTGGPHSIDVEDDE
jgi:hypothetical protein